MKTLMINRKPVSGPWGGGNNFISAMCDYAGNNDVKITHTLDDNLDYILMVDPRTDNTGIASLNDIKNYKANNPNTKVIYRCNECDARKGQSNIIDPLIQYASTFIDSCVFVSPWMLNYHTWEITKTLRTPWQCSNNIVLYNGVNKTHFRELTTKPFNNKLNIVTHHWSDNPMKGQDIYDQLDKWIKSNNEYTFTYIGRTKSKYTRVIEPLSGQALGDELQKYDIYVSASRFDPGPNHILESLACKLPTLAHVDGGGSVDMVGVQNTFKTFDELIYKLEVMKMYGHVTDQFELKNKFELIDWQECVKNYIDFIKSV